MLFGCMADRLITGTLAHISCPHCGAGLLALGLSSSRTLQCPSVMFAGTIERHEPF